MDSHGGAAFTRNLPELRRVGEPRIVEPQRLSGEKAGYLSCSPLVSCFKLSPLMSIRQRLRLPARVDIKTMVRPSGETAGIDPQPVNRSTAWDCYRRGS